MTCFFRHTWGPWEQYEQKYAYLPPADSVAAWSEFRGKPLERSRIRQKRRCRLCGWMQDIVVAELHS